ncbi:hypothetical protein RB195_011968 [Necator americanus]|uniref:Uncharacterized protein n=1 Tax=Necator americanus TaxID=51031 RepID=A0ABR1D4U6_NECAM
MTNFTKEKERKKAKEMFGECTVIVEVDIVTVDTVTVVTIIITAVVIIIIITIIITGSSPYGGYSGYGSGYGYGGGGGGGLLSVLGGLLGFRQPYYSSPSYYYSNYQTSPYASYYQPSSYSYYQPTYYQRAAYTCDVQQYMSMSGTRQLWYCVCSGTTSYQYDGCNHPYYG